MSVCLRAYLWNHWTNLHKIFSAGPQWPWLGPPLALLRYIMYFHFMDDITFDHNGPYGDCQRSDTGAESDVYECLVNYPHMLIRHAEDISVTVFYPHM